MAIADVTSGIKHQDCMDYLRGLPDKSVDMVLTDPPYGIGCDGGKGWDSEWDSESQYLQWCQVWTEECVRVLKDHRMMVVWGTLKTDTFLKYRLQTGQHERLCTQNEIVWSYNWGGRSTKNFARKHEYAWCFSTGEQFLFNKDDVLVPRKMKKNMRTGKDYTSGTIPTCVWEKNNHTGSRDYMGWHPTQKNVEVTSRLLRAYTNEGDVVLDPFLGSGTTAVACVRNNRVPIGCERDGDYYQKMVERVRCCAQDIE